MARRCVAIPVRPLATSTLYMYNVVLEQMRVWCRHALDNAPVVRYIYISRSG